LPLGFASEQIQERTPLGIGSRRPEYPHWSLHGSWSPAHRLHAVARSGLRPESHHRRRARHLQPRGVCQRREMLHSGRTTWTPWRTKRKWSWATSAGGLP